MRIPAASCPDQAAPQVEHLAGRGTDAQPPLLVRRQDPGGPPVLIALNNDVVLRLLWRLAVVAAVVLGAVGVLAGAGLLGDVVSYRTTSELVADPGLRWSFPTLDR